MEAERLESLSQYDVIQLSLTGFSGVVRKINISGRKLQEIIQKSGHVKFGHVTNAANSLLYDVTSCSGDAIVDLSTLRPLPWCASGNGEKVGGAFCEIAPPVQHPSLALSPRTAAVNQVKRLKGEFDLQVMSAFEAEFMVFEEDETTPFNNVQVLSYGRVDNMAGREDILLDACSMMEQAGLPLETFMTELATAQFEITFRPEQGVSSADSIMVMKDAVRIRLGRSNMVATYMAWPVEDGHPNGFHFNHSLWTLDGRNAFLDTDDPILLSDTARHWIAGLIHHAPALTALLSPTVNCYRRLADFICPKWATWGVENRLSYLRIKTDKKNAYIENRLPSSASNPYLVMAAILAAGMDGLTRKLTCPPPSDQSAPAIPTRPEDSIVALEQDTILINTLGKDFIANYIKMFRKGLDSKLNETDAIKFQREVFFNTI